MTRHATSKFCFSLPIILRAKGGGGQYHHGGNLGAGTGKRNQKDHFSPPIDLLGQAVEAEAALHGATVKPNHINT
ncbi:hypothetical protein EYF80_018687 [Liparis tanakae]|uniref:Uncharacterized protein n=1 Tax=Liparis tanakae TaxID=230148 RepID=A0A4Z2HZ09_9TELE|nr:hypothetical protein EYF80_018687 [Liparis tanakae]